MIKAGEAGGALEAILQRLADFKEKSQSLKRRIKSAMVYPLVVITVACAIVGFILYFIIPKFEAIFKDFGVDLPSMTKFLIKASHFVDRLLLRRASCSRCSSWIFLKLVYRNKTGAYICDRILLMIPVMGSIVEKSTVARTTRTLGHAGAVGRADPGSRSTSSATRRATWCSSGRSPGFTTRSAKARRSPSRSARRGSWTTSSST